jgi:hypothetical protein
MANEQDSKPTGGVNSSCVQRDFYHAQVEHVVDDCRRPLLLQDAKGGQQTNAHIREQENERS